MTPHPFMLTASGREYALGASPAALLGNAPDIKDIAHHLSQINRFCGACSRPYSVAEHSMLVERIGVARGASVSLRLALLLHDAHESYTGDAASPTKEAIGPSWTNFEAHHAANARVFFDLRTAFASYRREVSICDLIALATERRDLTAWNPERNQPWPSLDAPGREILPFADERIPADEPPLSWRETRDAFLNRYLYLRELLEAAQHDQTATA